MRNFVGLALSFFLVACSSGGGLSPSNDGSTADKDLAATTTGDMATATTHDLAMSSSTDGGAADGGTSGSVACGTMTCTAGNSCCITPNNGSPTYACMTTCGSGTFAAACDGPEDCSTGACCADVMLSSSSPSGDAACESATNDCSMANFDLTNKSGKTKLCHTPADCTGYMSNFGPATSCCAYNGSTYQFCAPSFASSYMGVTCMP